MFDSGIVAKLRFKSNVHTFLRTGDLLFLFQGAALIYHKLLIIWHQHLLEVQDKI